MVTRAYSGKTMRVIKNDTTERYELDPTLVKKFPDQLDVSIREGTFHLGGDDTTLGVDPRREAYPAGQAVGAIDGLVPAGELVTRIVEQADAILTRLSRSRSR